MFTAVETDEVRPVVRQPLRPVKFPPVSTLPVQGTLTADSHCFRVFGVYAGHVADTGDPFKFNIKGRKFAFILPESDLCAGFDLKLHMICEPDRTGMIHSCRYLQHASTFSLYLIDSGLKGLRPVVFFNVRGIIGNKHGYLPRFFLL